MKVAIVGAGITGLSVALQLAEGGAEVVVHERTGVAAGASGVQPGGVRQQWSTRVNCLLARESARFYRDVAERLEARTQPVLEPCGYIFLAHSAARREGLAADVALQNELDIPSVLLDPEGDLELRFGAVAECLYLIRPDLYIAYRSQPAELEPLAKYLSSIFV